MRVCGLILFASATWRARPRLAITPDGLAIRGWFRTQLLRHSNIKIIRIDEFRRYGRLVRLLEIETVSGGLLILSRWDLGTDPVEVLDALTAAGYAGRGHSAATPVNTRPGVSVTKVTDAIAITTPPAPQPAIPEVRGAHAVCCMYSLDPLTTADKVIHRRYQQWG